MDMKLLHENGLNTFTFQPRAKSLCGQVAQPSPPGQSLLEEHRSAHLENKVKRHRLRYLSCPGSECSTTCSFPLLLSRLGTLYIRAVDQQSTMCLFFPCICEDSQLQRSVVKPTFLRLNTILVSSICRVSEWQACRTFMMRTMDSMCMPSLEAVHWLSRTGYRIAATNKMHSRDAANKPGGVCCFQCPHCGEQRFFKTHQSFFKVHSKKLQAEANCTQARATKSIHPSQGRE